MELYGCVKGIDFLKEEGITIDDLLTDRSVTTKGNIKTKEPEIHHYFDPWHIAKGMQGVVAWCNGHSLPPTMSTGAVRVANQIKNCFYSA
ncbi:hypothetical protein HPB47_016029 [Ixodes persulcatus]|uniref:Uncharacterized protein n=1 Tax=Ixodes persulcatus TaxID=34615 RepID=A0AC60QS38_IXOPE|nr:hypothetical protein HPB47_016029 [Ixodes persulcatus]